MSNPLPSANQFGGATSLSDPAMQRLLSQLKPFDASEVLKSVNLASKDAEAAGAADIGQAVALPKITQVEHDTARFEIREINGHLVYYVELRRSIDPEKFITDVVKPAFGPLWGGRDTTIEGWLDSEATTQCGTVIGIWMHNFTLNAMNRAYFLERTPKVIAQKLASTTTP